MRECGSSCYEDSAHKRVFVIVAVYASWMVYFACLLSFFDVEFGFVDDGPACFRNNPQGSDALVLGEVVPLRHILVTEVDFNVRVVLRASLDLIIQTMQIQRVLGTQTVERPAVDVGELSGVGEVFELDEAGCVGCGHAVV